MGTFCQMVGRLLEKSVDNFQTKTTTGAYCATALDLKSSRRLKIRLIIMDE